MTENKFSKYLVYAVGEIVLVVIGILIALQINNLNEERKSQKRLANFLIEIQNNLSSDITKANYIIDKFIEEDSILRNITLNKVNLTQEKHTENRRSFTLIFEFENFRLKTKGFDGLVNNIDYIPDEYTEVMTLLNDIYIEKNNELVTLNQRVQTNTYGNRDNLKTKSGSSKFWDWELTEDMITYFQSNSYKNEVRHYFNDNHEFVTRVIRFKILAINAYKEIAKLTNTDIPIPQHVNYTYPDLERLSEFAGDYQIEQGEKHFSDSFKFIVDNNQLQWRYEYKDVNYDEEFNVPLYWHKNNIFILYQSASFWEFKKTKTGTIIYTQRMNGTRNSYIKRTKG
ncbi:hypothetical protein CLV82_0001 [Zeaxanthinibacter enoshimensis]|uniref:Uncharacterized protein n=1 Tax=Zeaxanthinibacter enoshimensis TaxID=392009 RepID=A0A4R6TTB3_9FLAO|nr:hypothetical protein CLV82_0001 [Zeaxanthinibacter enoshimensis]